MLNENVRTRYTYTNPPNQPTDDIRHKYLSAATRAERQRHRIQLSTGKAVVVSFNELIKCQKRLPNGTNITSFRYKCGNHANSTAEERRTRAQSANNANHRPSPRRHSHAHTNARGLQSQTYTLQTPEIFYARNQCA